MMKIHFRRFTQSGLSSFIALLLFSLSNFAIPQTQGLQDVKAYQIKAVYIYNFTRYVNWPSMDSKTQFELCVIGIDPFNASLDAAVADARVEQLPIAIRRISELKEIDSCQILYISASEKTHMADIIDYTSNKSVLTISDIHGFSEAGGMVEFTTNTQSKVRFAIALSRVKQSGLTMSSRLLKLADAVN